MAYYLGKPKKRNGGIKQNLSLFLEQYFKITYSIYCTQK